MPYPCAFSSSSSSGYEGEAPSNAEKEKEWVYYKVKGKSFIFKKGFCLISTHSPVCPEEKEICGQKEEESEGEDPRCRSKPSPEA